MTAQHRSPITIATEAFQARRVFGDPYEAGGATIIPVARMSGGGGGAGANGSITRSESSERDGDADAGGFGIHARPIGVYVVRESSVEWHPVIDLTRYVVGGQILTGLALILWAWRRRASSAHRVVRADGPVPSRAAALRRACRRR